MLSSEEFKRCIGSFPTGVAVVTATAADGTPVGVTVSSLTSVSLTPPLILFCLDKHALSRQAFSGSRQFRVHVLAQEQAGMAVRFAKRGVAKFAQSAAPQAGLEPPHLPDTHASMLCDTACEYDAGDHVILVGRVVAVESGGDTDPLVYYRGRFGRFSGDAPAPHA